MADYRSNSRDRERDGETVAGLVPNRVVENAYTQTNTDFWIITGSLVFLTLACAGVSLVLCRNNVLNDTYL